MDKIMEATIMGYLYGDFYKDPFHHSYLTKGRLLVKGWKRKWTLIHIKTTPLL